jgi:hypothetical protein
MIVAGFLMMVVGLMVAVLFADGAPGYDPAGAISAVFILGGSSVLMAGLAAWAWGVLS